MAVPALRQQVVRVYKEMLTIYQELLYLGRDYPLGYPYYRARLHSAFSSQSKLQDQDEINKAVARAEFVKKGDLPQEFIWLGIERLTLLTKEIEAL
ncbi:MAG: hypothetical protein Q9212_000475 [Teloschistes hypoglaucus]